MPVFMIGMQRSGSNLLRLMLNQLPGIAAPHPPHILERLGPFESSYGDLHKGSNFEQLVSDVCRLVETNPVKWESVDLDPKAIMDSCRERSLVAVYGAVHDCLARAWGGTDWLCKSMANVHHLGEIERYFGKSARFIYLYRDGRDVALSFRKALIGDKTFYHLGKAWDEAQQLSLALSRRVHESQFIALSYEELTSRPEPALRRLCGFLGAEYSPKMMEFHRSAEAQRTAVTGLWSNVNQPVDSKNSNKFLREASTEEIRHFESVAGESLDELNYPRHCSERGKQYRISSATLSALDQENKQLRARARKLTKPVDLKLRKPQARLMESIRVRFA
jgi:hypothetical protein